MPLFLTARRHRNVDHGKKGKDEYAITWGVTEALQSTWSVDQREHRYPQGGKRCDRVVTLSDESLLWLDTLIQIDDVNDQEVSSHADQYSAEVEPAVEEKAPLLKAALNPLFGLISRKAEKPSSVAQDDQESRPPVEPVKLDEDYVHSLLEHIVEELKSFDFIALEVTRADLAYWYGWMMYVMETLEAGSRERILMKIAEALQESIYHFAWAMKSNWQPEGGFKTSPLNYFMGCIRSNGIFEFAGYYRQKKLRKKIELEWLEKQHSSSEEDKKLDEKLDFEKSRFFWRELEHRDNPLYKPVMVGCGESCEEGSDKHLRGLMKVFRPEVESFFQENYKKAHEMEIGL